MLEISMTFCIMRSVWITAIAEIDEGGTHVMSTAQSVEKVQLELGFF